MGTKFSQTNNNDKKENHQEQFINNKYYNNEQDDGMYSIMQTKENTDNSSIMTTTGETSFNFKGNIIPVLFRFKIDRPNLFLCGSFANDWKSELTMVKNPKNGYFERIHKLPRGKYEFKFKIGNDWFCSEEYGKNRNGDIINNEIDLNDSKVIEANLKRIEESKNNSIVEAKKKGYNCKYPERGDLNTTAQSIISHYIQKFNIDYQSNQDILKNVQKNWEKKMEQNNYLKYKENNFNTENNTFEKILIWPHEKLMHLCQNLEDMANENGRFYRFCTTIRNKHKFLTIVYFKTK